MYKAKFKRTMPMILTLVGCVGVVVTSVMSGKASVKAHETLKEVEEKSENELSNMEKIKIATPIYIPTVLVEIGTITCLFGSSILNKRNQAGIASAYMMVDQAYKKYRNKVVELRGQEADDEIMDAIRVDHAKDTHITATSGFGFETCDLAVESDGKPVLFYEPYSQRYFMKKIEDVLNAEYHLNRNFILGADTNLNMFYSFLGLDETEAGDDLYWIQCDYYTWVDFDHIKRQLPDGREYYVIHMPYEPLPYELLEDHYL